MFPFLDTIKTNKNLDLEINKKDLLNNSGSWMGFSFTNNELRNLNIKITFAFNVAKGYRNFIYGYTYQDYQNHKKFDYNKLQEFFKNIFTTYKNSVYWPCYLPYNNYSNWEDLNTSQKIRYGDFKKDFEDKLDKMLNIVASIQKN